MASRNTVYNEASFRALKGLEDVIGVSVEQRLEAQQELGALGEARRRVAGGAPARASAYPRHVAPGRARASAAFCAEMSRMVFGREKLVPETSAVGYEKYCDAVARPVAKNAGETRRV